MYWQKLSVIVCLLCAFRVSAQQDKVDSLQKVLSGKLGVSQRAIAMKDLARAYEVIDTKKATRLYDQALVFANKQQLNYERAVIYQNKSFIYISVGDYRKAIKILDSALIFGVKSNHAKKEELIAKVYNVISTNYWYLGDYKNAVAFQFKAITKFEALLNYSSLVNSYYNLSLYYKEMNDYQKQLESSKKALEFAVKSESKEALFVSYVAIAQAYTFLEDYIKASMERDNALKNYNANYPPAKLIGYHLISGLINLNLKQLQIANDDFTNSLRIGEKNKQLVTVIQSKMQLSRVLAMQKKFEKAEEILKSLALEIAETQDVNQKLILLEYYARLYEEWGKYDKALSYHKMNTALSDSISSVENKNYVATLEKRYETEKKNSKIKLQEATIQQKNTLNYILIGSAVALMMIILLGYRNYAHKQKLQQVKIAELETEKQLTATEAVLKGEEQERTRLAKDLHDGLGGMLSGLKHSFGHMQGNLVMTPENAMAFNRSMDMLDSSIKEMRRVAHNMMPEALVKFGLDTALKDFCTDVNLTGALQVDYQSIGMENASLDNTTAITIFRIVQELLNNTMKHAQASTAIVQLAKTEQNISITVEDDGVGFNSELLNQVEGIGWSNIKNRVEFLKGKWDIQSASNKGTSVHIEFKI